MKRFVSVAVAAGAALTLAACQGQSEEAPAEAPAEEMAPAEEPADVSDEDAAAAKAAEGVDPNGNPIGPAAPGNPVGPDAPEVQQ
ncbi:MAG: hypothetical protein ACK4IB_08705 [Erythrobacter sp.]